MVNPNAVPSLGSGTTSRRIDTKEELYAYFTPQNKEQPEIHGGFASMHWSGDRAVEEQLKSDLSVTLRCIPLEPGDGPGTCPISGKPSPRRVIWAKSY